MACNKRRIEPNQRPDLGVEGGLLRGTGAAERRESGRITGQGVILDGLDGSGVVGDRARPMESGNRSQIRKQR
jgi:hypothetical protein